MKTAGELARELRALLDGAPVPNEQAPESGLTFEPKLTATRRILIGQCVAISRRKVEQIIAALKVLQYEVDRQEEEKS